MCVCCVYFYSRVSRVTFNPLLLSADFTCLTGIIGGIYRPVVPYFIYCLHVRVCEGMEIKANGLLSLDFPALKTVSSKVYHMCVCVCVCVSV